MSFTVYIVSIAFTFHAANAYILLTANLDDLHNIAKELAESPISDQIGSILRRAYNQFQQVDFQKRTRGYQQRAESDDEDQAHGSGEGEPDKRQHRRHLDAADGPKPENGDPKNYPEPASDSAKADTEYTKNNGDQAAEGAENGKENYYIKSINKVLDTVK